MSDSRSDIQIGIFTIIALVLLAMLVLLFGGFKGAFADTYTVVARFPNAAGTTEGTPVRLVGIEVGKVVGISLDPETGGVMMTLRIRENVDIRRDASISIKQEGFIANTYVEFSSGRADEFLPKDDTAEVSGDVQTFSAYIARAGEVMEDLGGRVQDQVSEVSEKLVTLAESLNSIAGDEQFQDDLKTIASNAGTISERLKDRLPDLIDNLNATAQKAQESLDRTESLFSTYEDLGKELTAAGEDARAQLARQGENLDRLTAGLKTTAEDFSTLMRTLNDIAAAMRAGEGSAGMLVKDEELYRSLVRSIDTISDAVLEIKDLARTLKEHPDWLLKGPPEEVR